MQCRLLIALTAALFFPSQLSAAEPLGFAVPKSFEVTLYADDDLATDIFSMTIDDRGRIVVAGKGYVKVLHDDNGDGKADRATLFSDRPKSGAHGMYFDGPDLIANGDNGIRRYRDADGDGKVDQISEPWLPMAKDTEHGANGILKGPDGWFYQICGNDVGISKEHVRTLRSPIKSPRQGALIRFTADGKESEVLAEGLRNPYDIAFNEYGQVFTVDADGERIYHLPYYSPTRLFDIAQGMHHGWVLPGWQRCFGRPQHFPDNVERLVEIGRGSPTGVLCYRHHKFPARYREGVFGVCWSFGRIYFFPLTRKGSSYSSHLETFLQTTGDVGFAPTDMAVGPNGDMFVSIGGRGTRGSVFRIHYRGELPPHENLTDPLRRVLTADEPLTSWSRREWIPLAQKLGREPFEAAAINRELPLRERIRAIEVLAELYGGVSSGTLTKLVPGIAVADFFNGDNGELAARAIWSVSCGNSRPELSNGKRLTDVAPALSDVIASRSIIASATGTEDPRVARAVWEALQSMPHVDQVLHFEVGLESDDRRVRAAALNVAQTTGRAQADPLRSDWKNASPALKLADLWLDEAPASPGKIATCLQILATDSAKDARRNHLNQLRLEAVRLLQLALGDVYLQEGRESVFIGYGAQTPEQVTPELRLKIAKSAASVFPTGEPRLDEEVARLLGMLGEEVPELLPRIAGRWPTGSVENDIHYLFVIARLPGMRSPEVTRKTAAALHGIFTQLAAKGARPSDQVPSLLEELFERLLLRDPALADALTADNSFGIAGEELFAIHLPEGARRKATQRFLSQIAKLDEDLRDQAWSPDLVKLVAMLPDTESLPILRREFSNIRLSDKITLILAAKAQRADRQRFLDALSSMQAPVVRAAADAILKIERTSRNGPVRRPREIVLAVRAFRRFGGKTDDGVRESLRKLLNEWGGYVNDESVKKDPAAEARAWQEWFTKFHREEANLLAGFTGANAAAWKQRIERIDWSKGDEKRGFVVFQKRNCFRCHAEAKRIGPDLRGVAQRFSVGDLFTHIVEPSKDISPTYQSKTYVTNSGKTYSGMIVYQSQEVTLLQTTPDVTVRLQQSDVAQVQPCATSFMPAGLLDEATDPDLSDLYAYLKTLRK